MPISILEAKANKLLPVVTPALGITDVVKDGINGVVSNDFSVDSYYTAMIKALNLSQSNKEVMVENGYLEYISEYEISACIQNYIQSYGLN